MAKKPKIEVDESLVKQVIAGQLPITTKVTRVIPEQIPSGTATDAIPAEPPSVPEIDTEKIPDETPSVPAAQEPRRRRTPPLSDYERMFLTPVEYGIRATLYVNASTKRKILEILKRIGGERLSATSYVDNILQHHIETFRDDINQKRFRMKPRLCPQHKSHAVGEHHPCPIMNECFSLLWNTASEPHFMSMHRRSVRFWRYLKESEVNDYPRHHMWIIFYSTTSKLSVTI